MVPECPSTPQDNDLKNIIEILGVSLFFIVSEMLPFIKKVKSNGITQLLVNYLKSPTNEEYSQLIQDEDL